MSYKENKIIAGADNPDFITYRAMSNDSPYKHTMSIPFRDIPLFIPKEHADILSYELELQAKKISKLSPMCSLNYAFRDLNKEVIPVAGKLWSFVRAGSKKLTMENVNGEIKLFADQDRLYSFHGRYWKLGWCHGYVKKGTEQYRDNAKVLNDVYNILNKERRVKLPNMVEVFDPKTYKLGKVKGSSYV
jgi:hypothetical protein